MSALDAQAEVRRLRAIPASRGSRRAVPLWPTPLIGRESELVAIADLVERDRARLVTLTGPTGIGKSHLALGVLERMSAKPGPDDAYLDCAGLGGADALARTLAELLGIPKNRRHARRQQVIEALASRPLVLLLDHLDQVRDAPAFAAELLAACPRLVILATARASLGSRWEFRYRVPPLATAPHDGAQPPAAIALFAARARAANPGFTLTAANGAVVAALCARLGGLPLAIEIAAAQADFLSPRALLDCPIAGLLDLHWTAHGIPPQHRTIAAAIAHDLAALAPAELAFCRGLAIFTEGGDLTSASAVLGASPADEAPLDQFRPLIERNLLRVTDATAEVPRFQMPTLVRDYLLTMGDSHGEIAPLRRRHTAYFLALAEQADAGMLGPERVSWTRRLERDLGNLRAALEWADTEGETAIALRLAAALGHFWWTRGLLDEGRAYLERALARAGDAPTASRAKALTECTIPLMWQGNYARARQCSAEALTIGRALADGRRVAEALVYLGWLADATGNVIAAADHYAEALAAAEQARDRWVAGLVLMNLGGLKLRLGDLPAAARALNAGLAQSGHAGDIRIKAIILSSLARVAREYGDLDGALARLTEALSLCRESGDLRATYFTTATAAALLVTRGDAQNALPLLTALDRGTGDQGEPRLSPADHTPRRAFTAMRRALADSPIAAKWAGESGHPAHQLLDEVLDALAVAPVAAPVTAQSLREREREVLRLVAAGLPNKQIAQMLALSERTVKAHLTTAMGKLGADNRAQAAVLAIQQQLL